jgi:restriction endonuclease S subunit
MNLKFKEISIIIPGYSFRAAIEPDWNSKVFVIQPRNIEAGVIIKEINNLTPVSFVGTSSPAFLRKGDVLVVSRGASKGSFKSSVFQSESKAVLATSSLFIVRLSDTVVLPEYLSLYLNSDEGQSKLLETVSGSYIQAISRKKFEELKIFVPSLEKQGILVQLSQNLRQQQKITERKNQIQKNIINSAFTNLTLK